MAAFFLFQLFAMGVARCVARFSDRVAGVSWGALWGEMMSLWMAQLVFDGHS